MLSFFFVIEAYSQYSNVTRLWEEKETKAVQLYKQNLYSKALDLYLEEKNSGGSSNELFLKIARCYYKLRDFSNALEYYEYPILRSSEESDYTLDDVYNYAETLVIAGRKDEAQLFYDEYYAASNDRKSINRMDGIFYYDDFFKDEKTVSISKIDLGSDEPEIAVVPYKDGIFFSTNADFSWPIDNEYLMGELPTFGLYYSEYKKDSLKFRKPSQIDVNLQLFNITSPVILKDSIVIVSANRKRIPLFNKEKYNYLKLYQAPFEGDISWGKFELMEINAQGMSIMTPSANEFGDTLYFASDNPTGQGGFDIYYVFVKDGSWSSPINLGAPVNTTGDEIYPFFKNGTLYFSSNGHPGIGGYDIYMQRNGARKVINFGSPVNSQYDDFNLSFEPQKDNSGYFVSNREAFGVEGNDDIYKFVSNRKERAFIQFQVSFQYDESPIQDAEIIVTPKNVNANQEVVRSDKNGIADLQVYLSDTYEVVVRKPPYFEYNNSFYIDQYNKIVKIELDRSFNLNIQFKTSV
jgi:tetratricopeptide (TPR) repeat protein